MQDVRQVTAADSGDEGTAIVDQAPASADNATKSITFYSLGINANTDKNSPDDLHGIINRREHQSGSEV